MCCSLQRLGICFPRARPPGVALHQGWGWALLTTGSRCLLRCAVLGPCFVALSSDVALKVLELMILKVFSTLDLSKSAQCRSGRGHKKGEDEHSGAATAGRCVAPCVEHREQTYTGCLRAQLINLASCTLGALPAPWPCHHSPARGEVLPVDCTKPQQANSIAYARVVGPRVSPGSELH